jgi:eukaryotic-like serine/threonine-protein kinase
VQIYEVGEQDGLPYFSLEFVEGTSLAQRLAGKPQPAKEAARLVETLAQAMHYAHERGIVHRDLKPANILLAGAGEEGGRREGAGAGKQGPSGRSSALSLLTPKITDFGLAKRLEEDSSQTRSGTLLGTPNYMAPEQVRGAVHEIGPPTDVYALGAILYEFLTGRPPFLGATVMDTLEQVRLAEPLPPSRLQSKVPRDLETICLKCLQKEARRRYASASDLAEDLRRFLAGEPILARPVSAPERLWRWCRRNPRVALLAAVALALLVTVAVTSTGFAVLLSRKQAETERQREEAVAARALADHKTEEAVAAQQLADQNAKVASEQGSLAVNALYTVVTKVQNRLRGQRGLQKLREDLLGDALAGLGRVANSRGTSALASRTRAAAYQRMGDLCLELGQTGRALEQYRQCQDVVEALARTDPGNDAVVWNLAVVHERLGDVYHQLLGDGAVAREHYRQCLQLRESLAKARLRTPEITPAMVEQMRAGSYQKLGNLALMLGDPDAAWQSYQRFLELREHRRFAQPREILAALRAERRPGKEYPISFYLRFGELSFHLGDRASSRSAYEEALRLSQATGEGPATNQRLFDQAASRAALGDWELLAGNPRRATEWYDQAHALYTALAAENPDSAEARRNLSLSFYRRGTARLALGEGNTAGTHYQESLKIRQALAETDPENAYKKIDLMLVLARCGDHARAAERAAALRRRAPDDPAMLFYVGCTYALCAQAAGSAGAPGAGDAALSGRYAALAAESLQRAVDRGYRDRVALETDPDLGTLRQQPDFRRLLERLKPGQEGVRSPQPRRS